MNRPKVILSAIALFAVVGGALAFKAVREENHNLFSYDGQNCTAPATTTYTTATQAGQAGFNNTLYFTRAVNGRCPITTWYTIQ